MAAGNWGAYGPAREAINKAALDLDNGAGNSGWGAK